MARFAFRTCTFAAIFITVSALIEETTTCPLHLSVNDIAKQSGLDLTGKTALVTGGRSGLGYAITEAMLQQNCTVIIASRNKMENIKAVAKLKTTFPAADVSYRIFDLESFASVRAFASSINNKHIHLNYYFGNAGQSLFSSGHSEEPLSERPLTDDGYEQIFQVNYLSQILLVELLRPLLRKSETPRIMLTGSSTHALACGFLRLDNGNRIEQTCFDTSVANNAMAKLPIDHPIDSSFGCGEDSYGLSKYLFIQAAIEINKQEADFGSNLLAFPWAPGNIWTNVNPNGQWCCDSFGPWLTNTCRYDLPNVCPFYDNDNQYNHNPFFPKNMKNHPNDPYRPYSRTEERCLPNHGAKAAIYAALIASQSDAGSFFNTYYECEPNKGLISQGMTDEVRTKLYNEAFVWARVEKNVNATKKTKKTVHKKVQKKTKKEESTKKSKK